MVRLAALNHTGAYQMAGSVSRVHRAPRKSSRNLLRARLRQQRKRSINFARIGQSVVIGALP